MQNISANQMNKVVFYAIGIVSLIILLRSAWIGDDAFITMRTVDNFVNGHGLTWNVSERVQTYTHPLWMLLLSIPHFFLRDGYFTLLLSNIVISIIVFILFIKYFADDLFSMMFGWSILVLSKAFIDYSTSGLENGLTHLLLLSFAILLSRPFRDNPNKRYFVLALLAGLGTTNRMDTILFYIPSLVYFWYANLRNLRGIGILLAGFAPFILWEIFSIIYYGFPFPNTAYAKLNSGISQTELASQGILYFSNSLIWDPVTLAVISITLLLAFCQSGFKEKALATGIIFYLAYVVYVGGDFMSGRFFSASLLIGTFLLTSHLKTYAASHKSVLSGIVLVLGLLSPTPTIHYLTSNPYQAIVPREYIIAPNSGIADERQYYYFITSPILLDRNMHIEEHEWVQKGIQYYREQPAVAVEESIGTTGYFAGPNVHIIDIFALSDPLLARLQMDYDPNWRIGHFTREIPSGYIDSLRTGKNRVRDLKIAEYYDKLSMITKGPLFSRERLMMILEMNSGKYDYLLENNESYFP